jgi:hypothetical protein
MVPTLLTIPSTTDREAIVDDAVRPGVSPWTGGTEGGVGAADAMRFRADEGGR